jgi:glycosyltransferase involved in cell wall biosynthesis
MKIIIYHSNIIRIGGVETFTYNMCKALSEYYDVLLLYKNCHPEQLRRLSLIVPCERYNAKKDYKCDVLILASSWDGYPDAVQAAKDYIQVIHANYKELLKTGYKYNRWNRTTKHIAVSKAVAKNFKEVYGIDCEVIYNILDEFKPAALKLVSATRLSSEKGYDRMIKLAQMLKEKGMPFIWDVYTDLDQYKVRLSPYFNYRPPTYDIQSRMPMYDYGVQLSDTEGYSYFINECLQAGTPVICTNFDSAKESVIDGENGYILRMDMSGIDLDKIANEIPTGFEYKPKTTVKDWFKVLDTKAPKKRKNKDKLCLVRAISNYFDLELNRKVSMGDEYAVKESRAAHLKSLNLVEVIDYE